MTLAHHRKETIRRNQHLRARERLFEHRAIADEINVLFGKGVSP